MDREVKYIERYIEDLIDLDALERSGWILADEDVSYSLKLRSEHVATVNVLTGNNYGWLRDLLVHSAENPGEIYHANFFTRDIDADAKMLFSSGKCTSFYTRIGNGHFMGIKAIIRMERLRARFTAVVVRIEKVYVKWGKRYKIGIKEIDEHHKMLIDIANKLYRAMLAGEGTAILDEIIDKLSRYTEAHFRFEEGVMIAYNYPFYKKHKSEHERFSSTIRKLREDFEAGKINAAKDILKVIKEWIDTHIEVENRKLALFLEARGLTKR